MPASLPALCAALRNYFFQQKRQISGAGPGTEILRWACIFLNLYQSAQLPRAHWSCLLLQGAIDHAACGQLDKALCCREVLQTARSAETLLQDWETTSESRFDEMHIPTTARECFLVHIMHLWLEFSSKRAAVFTPDWSLAQGKLSPGGVTKEGTKQQQDNQVTPITYCFEIGEPHCTLGLLRCQIHTDMVH